MNYKSFLATVLFSVAMCLPSQATRLKGIKVVDTKNPTEQTFNHPTTKYVTPENIQYQRDFVAEGKNWTMYFINNHKRHSNNYVESVVFVPEDYEKVEFIGDDEINCPPTLDHFRAHDLGNNDSFVGAVVSESIYGTIPGPGPNSRGINNRRREIKLPDEIGEYIFKVMAGKTKYHFIPYITDGLEFVDNADLYNAK